MSDDVEITGGCLCGSVRYDVSKVPLDVAYCHYRMCQKNTGSAFHIGVVVPREAFKFTKGSPKFYESSPVFHRVFCPDCGTPLMAQPQQEHRSHWLTIHIGTLDNPEDFVPTSHFGTESQLPWLRIEDDLPRHSYEADHIENAIKETKSPF